MCGFIKFLFVSIVLFFNLLYAKDYVVSCDKCIMVFALGDKTIKQLKQEVGE